MTLHRPFRILVVDDDRGTTDMLVWLLQMAGHEVVGLYAGKEALERFADFQPEVMLIDLAMPDTDGYELARKLRQLEGGKEVLLVAVTGFADEATRQLASAAGFDHYLVKPIDLSTLTALFESRKSEDDI